MNPACHRAQLLDRYRTESSIAARASGNLAIGLSYLSLKIYIRFVMPRAAAPLPPHLFQILLALADRDLHGLGIMHDVLERSGGAIRLWPAMLYRNLQRLVRE